MKKQITIVSLFLLCALSAPALSLSGPPRFATLQSAATHVQQPGQATQSLETIMAATETSGTLLENVLVVLAKRYYDEPFRKDVLPRLAVQYTARAKRAKTIGEQRNLVHDLLSRIPASHLGLLSKQTHLHIMYDLMGRPYPTVGFQLVEVKGKFYAFSVLEGGPGERAGLLAWDRIVSIDGVSVEKSPRVEWRSDDAYIPDDRDPAVHYLTTGKGESVRFKIERRRGKFMEITVAVEDYSALEAARNSARIVKAGGRSFGYVHFWYVHMRGIPELLKEKFEGEFGNADGLIVDLRGRGGNALAIMQIMNILRADRAAKNRPIIALIDRQSRSAKDVLAFEMKKTGLARLVGEKTAGAVIPATFANVGHDTILMFPSYKLPNYTDLLEHKPVEPDVYVERAGPLSAGNDPILKAGINEALKLLAKSVVSGRGSGVGGQGPGVRSQGPGLPVKSHLEFQIPELR
jgi:carboxyl-terminal processing protease